MIITVNIPDKLNAKLDKVKRDTGKSKSLQIRDILTWHFMNAKAAKEAS